MLNLDKWGGQFQQESLQRLTCYQSNLPVAIVRNTLCGISILAPEVKDCLGFILELCSAITTVCPRLTSQSQFVPRVFVMWGVM